MGGEAEGLLDQGFDDQHVTQFRADLGLHGGQVDRQCDQGICGRCASPAFWSVRLCAIFCDEGFDGLVYGTVLITLLWRKIWPLPLPLLQETPMSAPRASPDPLTPYPSP